MQGGADGNFEQIAARMHRHELSGRTMRSGFYKRGPNSVERSGEVIKRHTTPSLRGDSRVMGDDLEESRDLATVVSGKMLSPRPVLRMQ